MDFFNLFLFLYSPRHYGGCCDGSMYNNTLGKCVGMSFIKICLLFFINIKTFKNIFHRLKIIIHKYNI